MGVDASARARVLGITTEYEDLRGGAVQFLPQRIAVLAHGSTASTYSSEKWSATGADAAAKRFGYGSEIHLVLRELMPVNGDGVGSIPVDVIPLSDAAASTAAAGHITPSGTASATKTYYVRVSGILSKGFAIPSGAISVTNVCRWMAQAMDAVPWMPVVTTWTFGSPSAGSCQQGTGGTTGDGTVSGLAVASGGNPVPGVWTLTCTAAATNGGTFRLTDPDGVVVDSAVAVGVAETDCGGLAFTVTDSTTDYAVGNYFLLTVPATRVNATVKWHGETGNDVLLEVIDDLGDLTFAITQPTGGATNPTVDTPLTLIGSSWATMVLNGLNIDDTTALDAYQTWGEGRWGTLVHKPAVVFTGNTEADRGLATVVTAARSDDRVNCQLVAPGSPNLPAVVAARQLARIAKQANDNPPVDYGALAASGLIPGDDSEQWDYPNRDAALKAGSSTVEVVDGVVKIGNVVTMYAPEGEDPPAYSKVCHVVRLQNIASNVAARFGQSEWARAVLMPDTEVTVNPMARRPKDALTELEALIDGLADEAIIADRVRAKAGTRCAIEGPNRLGIDFLAPLSGNTDIIDFRLKFGFNFGG